MTFSERAGWGNPRLVAGLGDVMNPPRPRWRRLAAAFVRGPVRDTALIALGGLLVAAGYALGLAAGTGR